MSPLTDSTGPDPKGTPQPGDLLAGKYRVEHVLGKGGMGVVLGARNEDLGGRVAIKFLLPELAGDQVLVARFQREARAAVKIRSEHVARVLDVCKTETGVPFIVMEFLDGYDLGAVLDQRGRISVEDAIDYLLQACEALAEAHALGIVHRDLKPTNLFLATHADGSQYVKVMDFGISKMTEGPGDQALTQTGGMMGSPLYMAPEQMRSARQSDARTDIWALGAILFELVTGVPPFEAPTMHELIAMILQDEAPSLTERARGLGVVVPVELAAAVARALRKSPDQRYANVAELAAAIAPFGRERARISAVRIARVLERLSLSPPAIAQVDALTMAPTEEVAAPRVSVPLGQVTTQVPSTRSIAPKRASRSRTSLVFGVGAVALVGSALAFGLRPSAHEQPTREAASVTSVIATPNVIDAGAAAFVAPPPVAALAAPTPAAAESTHKKASGVPRAGAEKKARTPSAPSDLAAERHD